MPLHVNWSPLQQVHKRCVYTALSCDYCDPHKTHPARPEWTTYFREFEKSRLTDEDLLRFDCDPVNGSKILDILLRLDILPMQIENQKHWIFGSATIVTNDFMSIHLLYPAICDSCASNFSTKQSKA